MSSNFLDYAVGDITKTSCELILHGCNAQGVMGSGVAKALRDLDEKIFTEYRKVYEANGNKLELGTVIPVRGVNSENAANLTVFNCITQEFYGRDGKRYLNYGALAKSLKTIDLYMGEKYKGIRIAMPKIGAGLAGGDWDVISEIIAYSFDNLVPSIYVLESSEIP